MTASIKVPIPALPEGTRPSAHVHSNDPANIVIVPVMKGAVPDWKATAIQFALQRDDLANAKNIVDRALSEANTRANSENASARRNAGLAQAARNYIEAVADKGFGWFVSDKVREAFNTLWAARRNADTL